MSYNLYYKPTDSADYNLLSSFSSFNDTVFIHTDLWGGIVPSIAGCYKVTAVDSAQYSNESVFSNEICIDNCPDFWFPNVFTPNGDGDNDFFMAITPFSYIESIDLKIYNRWGQLIFESKNPYFQWDGSRFDNKESVPAGVYYYTCIINSIRLTGIEPLSIQGFLHLFRESSLTE